MTGGRGAVGRITRGTTNTNRLRRVDRWIAVQPAFRGASDPLVVDLGYGASGVTTFELASRLRAVRPDVRVLGLEIDPARVARAREQLAAVRAGGTSFARDLPVDFAAGGFEVPAPAGRRPAVIRALNVLRQYDESEVADAWTRMSARVAPGGLVVDGTCDEIGRLAAWIALDDRGPRSLTLSFALAHLERPSQVAERLPKALIHRNVPGERVHAVLEGLDRAWRDAAPISVYGPTQRFQAAVEAAAADGMPVEGGRARRRLGELTLPWEAVAPA